MKKFLVFSVEEYESRNMKLRSLMDQKGIDACIFTKGTNLIYFSGYLTSLYNSDFRPFMYIVPKESTPVLIVPALEYGGACRTSWCDDVRIWGGKKPGIKSDPIALLVDVLKENKLDRATIGFEFANGQRLGMTMEQYQQLLGALPLIKPVDNSGVVWPCRMVKSPAELIFLKKSAYANDMGFYAAVDAIKDGATEKEVEIAMMQAMTKNGAVPDFMTITAGVDRYDMMNPSADENVIMKNGDMVVMDFGCTYNHYYSDTTRGVFVGTPHPRAEELYKAVRDVSEHALLAAKPGNFISDIDAAAEKRIIELGYRDLMLHRTGHALGLEIHENPSIGPADHTVLQEGMTLAIEPGLYDYSVGGFRIEDDIVITKNGFEFLTNASRDIIVK